MTRHQTQKTKKCRLWLQWWVAAALLGGRYTKVALGLPLSAWLSCRAEAGSSEDRLEVWYTPVLMRPLRPCKSPTTPSSPGPRSASLCLRPLASEWTRSTSRARPADEELFLGRSRDRALGGGGGADVAGGGGGGGTDGALLCWEDL